MKSRLMFVASLSVSLAVPAAAQIKRSQPPTSPTTATGKPADPLTSVPKLAALVGHPGSELADVVERFQADQTSLTRRYDAGDSPEQRTRMRDFYGNWKTRLGEIDFEKLSQEGRVDYVLLDNYLTHQQAQQALQEKRRGETVALLPFADVLLGLQDQRRDMMPMNPQAAAKTLAVVTKQVDSLRLLFEASGGGRGGSNVAAMGGPNAASANGRATRRALARRPHASRRPSRIARADNLDQLRGAMRRLVSLLRRLRSDVLVVDEGSVREARRRR